MFRKNSEGKLVPGYEVGGEFYDASKTWHERRAEARLQAANEARNTKRIIYGTGTILGLTLVSWFTFTNILYPIQTDVAKTSEELLQSNAIKIVLSMRDMKEKFGMDKNQIITVLLSSAKEASSRMSTEQDPQKREELFAQIQAASGLASDLMDEEGEPKLLSPQEKEYFSVEEPKAQPSPEESPQEESPGIYEDGMTLTA